MISVLLSFSIICLLDSFYPHFCILYICSLIKRRPTRNFASFSLQFLQLCQTNSLLFIYLLESKNISYLKVLNPFKLHNYYEDMRCMIVYIQVSLKLKKNIIGCRSPRVRRTLYRTFCRPRTKCKMIQPYFSVSTFHNRQMLLN